MMMMTMNYLTRIFHLVAECGVRSFTQAY